MSVTIDGDEYVGICVDLFSGTESFSQAFDDSDDWFVLTIEKNDQDGVDFEPDLETDVRELTPWDIRREILERTEQDVAVEERFQTDPERNTDPVHGKVVDEQPDDPKFAFVILASPPCTTFSRASMGKYWRQTGPDEYAPKTPKSRRRVALTHHTLYLIHSLAGLLVPGEPRRHDETRNRRRPRPDNLVSIRGRYAKADVSLRG